MMPIISLKGVSKCYHIFPRQRDRIKELLSFGRVRKSHDFWALTGVDLEVEQGTTLGILGRNGAGKSTLLKIISGVLRPTAGDVRVNGRLVALLELGAGFNPEFTGRENAIMNGLILGIDRATMRAKFDEIEAFADIGEFIDQPVKFYSSGMKMRLAFAVAVNVDPDILVVDEALSVGDVAFQHRCMQRMRQMRQKGTTVLLVSHSVATIKNFCTDALLLHEGRTVTQGDTSSVVDQYNALWANAEARRRAVIEGIDTRLSYRMTSGKNDPEPLAFKEKAGPNGAQGPRLRHGTGEARVRHVELLNSRGEPAYVVYPHEAVTIRVHLEYLEPVTQSSLGITIRNAEGLDIFQTSTADVDKALLGSRTAGERVTVDFACKLPLTEGNYSVNTAVSSRTGIGLPLDWVDVAAVFELAPPQGREPIHGLVDLPTRIGVLDESRREDPDYVG
jgi:ABC-type polysaccharide/polyol phosphate transport system ATPase subunit